MGIFDKPQNEAERANRAKQAEQVAANLGDNDDIREFLDKHQDATAHERESGGGK